MKVDGSPINDRTSAANSPSASTDRTEQISRTGALGKLLKRALHWWLRSQLDHLDSLHIAIDGSNRQILSGCIPRVVLAAENAVYQGIALRWVQVTTQQIRVSTSEILQGHPLVLSEPIPIDIQVQLTEADINASLATDHHNAPSLLANALYEVLQAWWQSTQNPITQERLTEAIALCAAPTPTQMQIQLQPDGLLWEIANHQRNQPAQTCILQTGLQAHPPSQLQLQQPHIQIDPPCQWLPLAEYAWDLGPEVTIDELTLETGQLSGKARLQVNP